MKKTRSPIRLVAGAFGVLLLIFLIRRAGPTKLLESMAALGWRLSLVIALGGVAHILKTWAWRLTLLEDRREVSFARMLGLRLASEAVGQLGFLGQMFGENLRVALLGRTIPLASGIASVTLDKAFFVLSGLVIGAAGLIAVLIAFPLPHALSLYAGIFASMFMAVLVVAAWAVQRRWALVSGTAQILGRIRVLGGWIERQSSLIESVEHRLLNFYHRTPAAFWGSFALNLAGQAAAILEVYLILLLLGAKISVLGALAIEALTKLVNIVGLFNPGNIGTYEGGNVLIARLFGLTAATGLTLGLVRRVRGIFWAAAGGACLVLLSKSRKETSPVLEVQKKNELGRSHVAVILACDLPASPEFHSKLPRVGALPVLLRAVLGAEKAGASRIVVIVNRDRSSEMLTDLKSTGRFPRSVEWLEIGPGDSFGALLRQLANSGEDRVVLISSEATFHPSLHRRVAEWNGESDGLALMDGAEPIGMYALSRTGAIRLAHGIPRNLTSLNELRGPLMSAGEVDCEQVEPNNWQRVSTAQDRFAAERKLDSWLVKPTDGVFARFNRRISIPISRQLIKFPITPNMVSLFTLGVSFLAGLFFALGGYWNMLLGAILSVFASILDGSDGEVARLKFQESAFGCWLETICDQLYYLFVFAGITIGLTRSSGSRGYLVWGGLLIVGAVLSFVVTGMQRHRLTAEQPEQLLKVWQAQAERRRSNPFLYFGRQCEFIVRRCFMPYAVLFFAVLNITNVLLVLAALGANLVWPIALYTYLTFTPVQRQVAGPPVSA